MDPAGDIYHLDSLYTKRVTKRLIDIDDEALLAAQAELGASTYRDTVNEALRRVTQNRAPRVKAALDVLGRAELDDRVAAWR